MPKTKTPPESAAPSENQGSELRPTLLMIHEDRRPKPSTVCEACPASLWFASVPDLKCYCRIMHVVTYDSGNPTALTHCDGLAMQADE